MDQPRVVNHTDFIVEPTSLYGPEGEMSIAIAKSTWWLVPTKHGHALELAEPSAQHGVRYADIHWDDPATSSVRFPCDLALTKVGTDVVILADACAPGGEPRPHIDVKATIGPLESMLRAHGPRVWLAEGRGVSEARPAARVPIRWELAFGGLAEKEPGLFIEEARNPVGTGIAADARELESTRAPQVERVDQPIQSAGDEPALAGFGAIARHWSPRREYAGTYDAAWHDDRAPRPPKDQDPHHALFAAPGLHATTPLSGGEDVTLVNLSPHEPVLTFQLPNVQLELAFELRGDVVHRAVAPVDTIIIDLTLDTDHPLATVELIHRASVLAPRRKRDLTIIAKDLR